MNTQAVTVYTLCLLQVLLATNVINPPRYIIDLDQPPEERWARVAEDYSAKFGGVLAEMEQLYSKEVMSVAISLADHMDKYFPYPYADELRGFVKYAGGDNLTMGMIVIENIYYDLTTFSYDSTSNDWFNNQVNHIHNAACTTVLASDENSMLLHGHNMDCILHDTIKDLIIEVQFKNKHNPNIFTSTTIAGMIGTMLGAKPGGFSISVNTREVGGWWENIVLILKEGGFHGLSGLRVRDILQTEAIDFQSAVERLSTAPIISPYYFIVGGLIDTQGVVITRDRTAVVDKWFIDPPNRWYIIETNYDHWNSPPADDNRRDPGIEVMNSVGRAGINIDTLFTVLSTPPMLWNRTIWTTIMVPREGSEFYYNTTLRYV